MRASIAPFLALAFVGACDRNTADAPAPADPAPKEPEPSESTPTYASDEPLPMSAKTREVLEERWTGVWLVQRPNEPKEIWQLEDDALSLRSDDGEQALKWQVVAPCKIAVQGGNVTNYHAFAFDADGQLYLGPSRAGVIEGETMTACSLSGVYTYEEGTCRRWQSNDDERWTDTSVPCSVEGDGQGLELVVDDPDFGPQTWKARGSILVHTALPTEDHLAERFSSLSEAEAKLASVRGRSLD